MSAAGTRLALQAEPSKSERSPLAYLIHALNQPLTGLQCSLELAAKGPRRTDQYLRTLRDGLELTARMRVLVEAMRELAENGSSTTGQPQRFQLNVLLRDAVDDLLPVARERHVEISLGDGDAIEILADRRHLAALTFRLLDSALSLASAGSVLRIGVQPEGQRACIRVSWSPGSVPEHSPFSRPELGLLVARAGWEQASAEWNLVSAEGTRTCTIRLPLPSCAGFATHEPRDRAASSSPEGDLS